MKLRFTQRALLDLQRLRGFIAKKNPPAARTIIDGLRTSIRHLAGHPSIGTQLGPPGGLRQWVSGDYVVRYLPEKDAIYVVRIWHGKERRPEPGESDA